MFRRTLASAVLAASLLAAEVVVLTLYLNPGLRPLQEARALAVSLFLPYLVLGTTFLLAVVLVGSALRRPIASRPPFPRMPWFLSLALVAVVASASLFWLNLWEYRHSIPLEFLRALTGSAIAVSAAALVLLAVATDALLFPDRGRAAAAVLLALGTAGAVTVPLALRPAARVRFHPVPLATEAVRPVRRVILMGVDGLSPELLQEAISRGQSPTFARLIKRGAHGPLATLRPTEAPPLWTTIVTGRFPRDHGVKSFVTYRLLGSNTSYELLPKGALVSLLERMGLASTSPVTSAARKRRALWNVLNAFGLSTGVVRIWGTYPTEQVQGFMLSHYFHLLRDDPVHASDTLYPGDLLPEASGRAVRPSEIDPAFVSEFVDQTTEPDRSAWRHELVERALAPDLTYERAGTMLRAAYDPPFFATYVYGLDVVGHFFLRFARPDRFGDVRPEESRRYGRVFDRYLTLVGQWVGELEKGLRPGEVLLVVSAYGMEPVPLWRRLIDGVFRITHSGTHQGAPDGLILAVGDGIRAGATVTSASVLDVTPTILYLCGLPVARDMEGRALTEMLEEDFARAHPVTFIPSYESLAVAPFKDSSGGEDLPPLPDEGP